MFGENSRHQRAGSLGYRAFNPYSDNYSLRAASQALLDETSMEDGTAWNPFNPQCLGLDQAVFSAVRTPHDDLCAHPPKCPTASHSNAGSGFGSSHMLFHTRHFNLEALSSGSGGASSNLHQPAPGLGPFVGYDSGPFFPQEMVAASGPAASIFSSEDFGEQLSALSSPPTMNSTRGGEEDRESVCDSNCDFGTICHDTVCSEDPSACCEDENCMQTDQLPLAETVTSEDAIAAAALASIGEENRIAAERAASLMAHPLQQHGHSASSAAATPCLPLGAGPDLCVSPEFLTSLCHFQKAHKPSSPNVCTEPACPVEDPSFYQQCHILHSAHDTNHEGGLFDNIDLDMMMSENGGHNHSHKDAVECGARFPDSHSMYEHLLNEHGTSLGMFQSSFVQHNLGLGHTFANESSYPAFGFGTSETPVADKTEVSLETLLETDSFKAESTPAPMDDGHHECLWCDGSDGAACSQVFGSAGDLHKHVLDAHTHRLKRGPGGMFSCSWKDCTRREGEDKNGFVQKSKLDRHMQVHTGNKPFTCDICCQSFSANQALVQHRLIHEDIKPLKCHICSKTFRQHSALTMHIRTHTKVRPLKCPHCNKEFSESSNLSKHKRIHSGEGQFLCKHPGCGRAFHRRDQLRRHSSQHSKATTGRVEKSSPSPSPPSSLTDALA